MLRIVLLADRERREVLPALADLPLDVKAVELSVRALEEVPLLEGHAILVDAAENPGQGHAVLRALDAQRPEIPVLAVVERRDLERLPWDDLADGFVFPSASEAEIAVRLAMARRRLARDDAAAVRLGPLVLDTDAFRASVNGRPLDLTFKEFELLRHLAEHPGRAFGRPALLRDVWGFDFYGGTRTVDVHVRRVRAKLGPEHEHLIETVRGVGYRGAPDR